jgi:hypothetical protein
MLKHQERFTGSPGPGNNNQPVVPVYFIIEVPFRIQRDIGNESILDMKQFFQHRTPPLSSTVDKITAKMSSVLDKNNITMSIVLDKSGGFKYSLI